MTSEHRGRSKGPLQRRPLKPEERAGLQRAALQYRAMWRAERSGTQGTAATPPVLTWDADADRRSRFAAAIARAEFGRFYWKAAPAKIDAEPVRATETKRPRSIGARPVQAR